MSVIVCTCLGLLVLTHSSLANIGSVNGGLKHYIDTCIYDTNSLLSTFVKLLECLKANVFCCKLGRNIPCQTQIAQQQIQMCGIIDTRFPSSTRSWYIAVSELYTVNMTFIQFNLPFSSEKCRKGKVQVSEILSGTFNTQYPVGYYCGTRQPWSVYKQKNSASFDVLLVAKHDLPSVYGFCIQYQAMDINTLRFYHPHMIFMQYRMPGTLEDKTHLASIDLLQVHSPCTNHKLHTIHVMTSPLNFPCLEWNQSLIELAVNFSMIFYNGPGQLSPQLDIYSMQHNCSKHEYTSCTYKVCFESFHAYVTYEYVRNINITLHTGTYGMFKMENKRIHNTEYVMEKSFNVKSETGRNYFSILDLHIPFESISCMRSFLVHDLKFQGMTTLYEETSMPCQYGGLYVYSAFTGYDSTVNPWKTMMHICSSVSDEFSISTTTIVQKYTYAYRRLFVLVVTFGGYTYMNGLISVICSKCPYAQRFECGYNRNVEYITPFQPIPLYDKECFQFQIHSESDCLAHVGTNRTCMHILDDRHIELGPIHIRVKFDSIQESAKIQKAVTDFNPKVKIIVDTCPDFPYCRNKHRINASAKQTAEYEDNFEYASSVSISLHNNNTYNPYVAEVIHVEIHPHLVCYETRLYNITYNGPYLLAPLPCNDNIEEHCKIKNNCHTYIQVDQQNLRNITVFFQGFSTFIFKVVEYSCFIDKVSVIEYNENISKMYINEWTKSNFVKWTNALYGAGSRMKIEAKGNCEKFTMKLSVMSLLPVTYDKTDTNYLTMLTR